jgi:hypothetical protein
MILASVETAINRACQKLLAILIKLITEKKVHPEFLVSVYDISMMCLIIRPPKAEKEKPLPNLESRHRERGSG